MDTLVDHRWDRLPHRAREVLALKRRHVALFQARLRELLTARGWTQEQLAEQVGVSLPCVKKWMGKKAKNLPQSDLLLRLAALSGHAVEWFIQPVDGAQCPQCGARGTGPGADLVEDLRLHVQTRVRARAKDLGVPRGAVRTAAEIVTNGDNLVRLLEDLALAEILTAKPRLQSPDVGWALCELIQAANLPPRLAGQLNSWYAKQRLARRPGKR